MGKGSEEGELRRFTGWSTVGWRGGQGPVLPDLQGGLRNLDCNRKVEQQIPHTHTRMHARTHTDTHIHMTIISAEWKPLRAVREQCE